MKSLKTMTLLGLLVALGCVDMDVPNLNAPDTARVLVTADDVQALISGAFLTYWVGTEDWSGPMGLSTIADENTSSWGNEGMKDMSSEPRTAFTNTTSYGSKEATTTPWYGVYTAISGANDGLRAILDPDDPIEIGIEGADTPRAKAFARFMQGIGYGFLAAMFDQAFIVDETDDMDAIALGEVELLLSPYTDVMVAAIGYLEKCITLCANTFTLPSAWINEVPLTNEELGRVAHSFIARFTAAVARTETERAAVDWASVKTHAAAGILEGEDFGPVGDGYINWYSDYRYITYGPVGWMRADYKTIGLADTSSGYEDWLASPVSDRDEFLLYTADRRITGATDAPETDGTYFGYEGPSPFRRARGTYHFSYYGYNGYREYVETEEEPMPTLTYVERRLLEAEAEYRAGTAPYTAAAAIVNETRVANGELPALDGSETDFFEWLKYEKKIETFGKQVGLAFFDRRGWGDLVKDTPLHFPVPAKELEVGQLAVYTFGGPGGDMSAPKRIPGPRGKDAPMQ